MPIYLIVEEGRLLGSKDDVSGLILIETEDGAFRRLTGQQLADFEASYPGFIRQLRDRLG